jgi:hypothetical protein
MLLQHLSAMHPDQVGPYLARMAAGENIATVAAEAYEDLREGRGATTAQALPATNIDSSILYPLSRIASPHRSCVC